MIPEFLQKEHNIACVNQVIHYSKKWWIEFGGPTNVTDLQIAASFGIQYLVEYYLNQGADIDASDSEGMTALHKASKYGHVGVVQLLLDFGAAIALRDPGGYDALVFAVSSNEVSVSRLLLQSGSDPRSNNEMHDGYSNIRIAASYGYEEILQLLVEYETDEFKRNELMGAALVEAARRGHEGIVRFLIRDGKEWNISKRDLERAISVAAMHNYVTIMEILARGRCRY